jgi:hypothetical protein
MSKAGKKGGFASLMLGAARAITPVALVFA